MGNQGVKLNRKALKDARIRQGLTIRALAEACEKAGKKVDYSNLCDYENGVHQPGPRNLFVIAKALGMSVDELRDMSEDAAA
jgi:transcriptional regulator with XRE-family HTH domain